MIIEVLICSDHHFLMMMQQVFCVSAYSRGMSRLKTSGGALVRMLHGVHDQTILEQNARLYVVHMIQA